MAVMTRSGRYVGMASLGAILAFVCCAGPFERIADRLDDVAKSIEEYGTISISSPLLFDADTERFDFGLKRDAQQYFDDAKQDVQGAAAAFLQRSVDTQAGLTVQFDYNDYLKNVDLLSALRDDQSAFRLKQDLTRAGALMSFLGAVATQPSIPNLSDPAAITGDIAFNYLRDEQGRLLSGLGGALSGLATSFPGPTSRPTFPDLEQSPPALASPLPTTRTAQNALVSPRFQGFQEMLKGQKQTISSGTAVDMAASHHRKQALHNFLSNPTEAAQFYGKRLYMAVMMVSVQPGDRTYRDFRASLAVRVSMGHVKGVSPCTAGCDSVSQTRNNTSPTQQEGATEAAAIFGGGRAGARGDDYCPVSRVTPLIAAVTPMTETQALDLKSSIREQQAVALRFAGALSGMGAEVQAEFFRDWVERLETDVATRTTLNTVTSYSVAGGMFGYEVAPQLQGLKDPTGLSPEAGMVLQPMTFPVLLICGVDQRDLDKYNIDAIGFHQTTRWLRTGVPKRDGTWIGRWYKRTGRPRLSERDMLRRATALADATHDLSILHGVASHECSESKCSTSLTPCKQQRNKDLVGYMGERIAMYGFLAGTSAFNWQTFANIELEKTPKITGVYPTTMPAGVNPVGVVLTGVCLDRVNLSDPSKIRVVPAVGRVEKAEYTGGAVHVSLRLSNRTPVAKVVLGLPYGNPKYPRIAYSPEFAVPEVDGPAITELEPREYRAGKAATLVLAGPGLAGLAISEVNAVIKQKRTPITTGRLVGGSLILSYTPPATITSPTPVVFEIVYTDGVGQSRKIVSPPAIIRPKPTAAGPVTLQRKTTIKPVLDSNGKPIPDSSDTVDQVQFPGSVKASLVERFLTTQPCCEADVEVKVITKPKEP